MRTSRINGIRALLKAEGSRLAFNDSKTMLCPFCYADWEAARCPINWRPNHSLKITRVREGFVYLCYRASCAKKGLIVDGTPINAEVKEFVSDKVDEAKECLPIEVYAQHLAKYQLPYDMLISQGVNYLRQSDALCYNIYSYEGIQTGEVVKWLIPHEPKAKTYKHVDCPKIHFPLGHYKSSTIVLVEDVLSSLKLNPLVQVGALLGSTLGDDVILHLKRLYIKNIYLMYDGDAVEKAYNDLKRIASLFDNARVITLNNKKDPKDLSIEEAHTLLQQYGVIPCGNT